jgi:hypothetical protein
MKVTSLLITCILIPFLIFAQNRDENPQNEALKRANIKKIETYETRFDTNVIMTVPVLRGVSWVNTQGYQYSKVLVRDNGDTSNIFITKYKNDTLPLETVETSFSEGRKATLKIEHRYDASNLLISTTFISPRQKFSEIAYTYKGKRLDQSVQTLYSGRDDYDSGQITRTYEYDTNNRLKQLKTQEKIQKQDKREFTRIYKYDDRGNIIAQSRVFKDEEPYEIKDQTILFKKAAPYLEIERTFNSANQLETERFFNSYYGKEIFYCRKYQPVKGSDLENRAKNDRGISRKITYNAEGLIDTVEHYEKDKLVRSVQYKYYQ